MKGLNGASAKQNDKDRPPPRVLSTSLSSPSGPAPFSPFCPSSPGRSTKSAHFRYFGRLGRLGRLGWFGEFFGVVRVFFGALGVLWESRDPAAVAFSYLFECDNFHFFSSVTELLLGEPVYCTSFFDDDRRYRSIHQNVHQEDLWIGTSARLFARPFNFFFSWWWPSCI